MEFCCLLCIATFEQALLDHVESNMTFGYWSHCKPPLISLFQNWRLDEALTRCTVVGRPLACVFTTPAANNSCVKPDIRLIQAVSNSKHKASLGTLRFDLSLMLSPNPALLHSVMIRPRHSRLGGA